MSVEVIQELSSLEIDEGQIVTILEIEEGTNTIVEVESGAVGGVNSIYTHTQTTPALIWMINHGLGYNPNVTVADVDGEVVFAKVTYLTNNILTVTFSSAFAGQAYLS